MIHRKQVKTIWRMSELLLTFLLIVCLTGSTIITPALRAQSTTTSRNAAGAVLPADHTDAADACDNLLALAIDETIEQSARPSLAEPGWIMFMAQPNTRYRLEIQNAAGLDLSLHDRCDVNTPGVPIPDGQLEFTAIRDGPYYVLVQHDGTATTSASGYQVTLTPGTTYRPSFAPMADIPEAVQRRAAEFLEEMRGSELAPEWREARLSENARILYRPDMQEPAYYEFTVEKPVNDRWEPAGFIQLAADAHDYPVTQWDVTGMSPTQELEEIAPLGVTVTEFYKLNSLAYVAEYEELHAIGIATLSDEVLNIGDLPAQLTGLDAIPEEAAELVTEGIDSEGNIEREGPEELPLIEQEPWDSWAALKAGYADTYAPSLKSLRERASDEWELINNLQQHGETLIKGDVRIIEGLPAFTLAAINVSGDGAAAQYLQQEQLSEQGVLSGIKLTVIDEPVDLQTRLTFTVELQYTDSTTETLPYAIVNAAALTLDEFDLFIPIVRHSVASELPPPTAADSPELADSWGLWHYYWAHGDAGSIRYDQIPPYTRVNTSGCYSGCGATAWAMLFGWVDRRAAEGHSTWGPHWGIYRVNGGLGANAVAPLNQDAGVDNMTWYLRGHLRTYCSGTGGATKATDMIRAADYVRSRATAAWWMQTKYDPTGLCWFGACDRNRDLVRDQIVNRHAPAVLGKDNHYPMAFGYAWRKKRSCFLFFCNTQYSRWFYVNNGWGGYGNGWTEADDIWLGGVYNDNR